MNIELLASDIASRIPEMARDSAINNHRTIKGILQRELQPKPDHYKAAADALASCLRHSTKKDLTPQELQAIALYNKANKP